MLCPKCQTEVPQDARHCLRCNAFVPRPPAQGGANPGTDDAVMRMVIPIGRSWVAIVAGYLGLFSLLLLPAPLALIAGVLAILHIKRNPGKLGMGRAVFAIATGTIGTGILLTIAIASAFE